MDLTNRFQGALILGTPFFLQKNVILSASDTRVEILAEIFLRLRQIGGKKRETACISYKNNGGSRRFLEI